LIDTGATACFYNAKLLETENFEYLKNFIGPFSVPTSVVVVNGTQVPNQGHLTVPLVIDDDTYEVELNVKDGLPFDIILGMDFCTKNGFLYE